MNLPDGFARITSEQLDDLRLNAGYLVNEFSPFATPSAIERCGEGMIIDRYYGQVYQDMKLKPVAVYGRTIDIPPYSGDQLANRGYLRVPFRRIPRRLIRDRQELQTILASIRSADSSLKLLYRGQNREHLISRSTETTQWLYGEDAVLEPSITTSASRRSPSLDDVLPEWCMLIKLFVLTHGIQLLHFERFSTDMSLPFLALALAQHYGLPTAGLDVTDKIEIALFFALMKYEKSRDSHSAKYSLLSDRQSLPVIYVLSPHEQQQFDYESLRAGFPKGRPEAQSARFLHIGWGSASNACANRVFLALYLDPDGDFGPIPTPSELFPSPDTDLFSHFLQRQCELALPATLRSVLREGYYSVDVP